MALPWVGGFNGTLPFVDFGGHTYSRSFSFIFVVHVSGISCKNMYNTYSGSGANYQRGYMRNTNLGFFIGTESSGSSAQRDLILTNPSGIVGLMGTGGVETIFTKEALQDVVAASSDFANFKVNVAAL